MTHLDTQHDLIEYACDCGCLTITIEVRGDVPNRHYRCNGCGDSVTTTELMTRNGSVIADAIAVTMPAAVVQAFEGTAFPRVYKNSAQSPELHI